VYTVIAPFVMPRCAFPLPFAPGALHYNGGMPIYTYQCALCGEKKEVARSYYLGDVIEPKCDRCGIEMMRVYEAPAVVYKGSGFYSTDKDKK